MQKKDSFFVSKNKRTTKKKKKKIPFEFWYHPSVVTLNKKKLRFDDDFGAKKCSCFEEDRPCPVHFLDEDTLGIDQLW